MAVRALNSLIGETFVNKKKKKIVISVNIFKDEKYMYTLHLIFIGISFFSVTNTDTCALFKI